jgi:hypothetical protein
VRPPDKRARRPICLRRHAACVHHNHIGHSRLPLAQPRSAQPVAHCFAIRACGPASEMLYVKSRHPLSVEPCSMRQPASTCPRLYWGQTTPFAGLYP